MCATFGDGTTNTPSTNTTSAPTTFAPMSAIAHRRTIGLRGKEAHDVPRRVVGGVADPARALRLVDEVDRTATERGVVGSVEPGDRGTAERGDPVRFTFEQVQKASLKFEW